jgi:hypothetical protein
MPQPPRARTLALWASITLTLTACERAAHTNETGAKSTAAPATQPTAEELADVRALVDASAPTPPPASGLPPGHPPLDAMQAATPPAMPPAPAAEHTLAYTVPDNWERASVSSPMRTDQFRLPAVTDDVEDGELIVFYFGPGGGGGTEANIARWRGQFSQSDGSPIPDEQVVRETFEANGLTITLLDVAGRFQPGAMQFGGSPPAPKDNHRLLAAIVEGSGGPWFIKATGPTNTMTEHRDAFVAFLRSMNVE